MAAFSLAFAPSNALTASVTLTVAAASSLAFAPANALTAHVELDITNSVSLAFAPSNALAGNVQLIVARGHSLAFAPSNSLVARVALSGMVANITLADAVDVVLGTWGMFKRCSAPAYAIEEAVRIVNASLQMVWNNAAEKSYWSRQEIPLSFAVGVDLAACPDEVQNVIGPAWINAAGKQPLVPVGTRSEIDNFASHYLEGESATEPLAYYVDRTNQDGDEPAKVQIRIAPAPTAGTVAILMVAIVEPTRYTVAMIADRPVIPIPHTYVESLLLPICRYNASTFSLFIGAEQLPSIVAGYRKAVIDLGLADPLPGKAGDNLDKRKETQPA